METEFVLAFLNSTTKTVINSKYDLHIRSGWVTESIDAELCQYLSLQSIIRKLIH